MQDGVQRTGSVLSNNDHLGASWDQYFVLEHLREEESGGTVVTAHVVTYEEDVSTELIVVGDKVMEVDSRYPCAKNSKCGAKIFVREDTGRVKEHDICHSRLDASYTQIAYGASRSSAAVFACGESSRNFGKTGDLTGLDVAEQFLLLNFFGEV